MYHFNPTKQFRKAIDMHTMYANIKYMDVVVLTG
jgi:hypothetical protein